MDLPSGNLTMKNGGLMGFNIDLTNKNGDFNGIYPLVMTNSLRT
jgi:hypothetical protein